MLPKINHALFDLEVPSTKQTIKVRQMTAREEKLLLMAKTDPTGEDVLNAVKQAVNNCIVTEGIDIDKLALFDIDFLFIKLRALSVSKKIKVSLTDNEDNQNYDFEVDLDKTIVKFPDVNNTIENGTIKIVMKYPEAGLVGNKNFLESTGKDVFDLLIFQCTKEIWEGDRSFDLTTVPIEEFSEFIGSLSVTAYEDIRKFINNLPTVYYEIDYKNSLGKERKVAMNSLSDFFQF